MQITMGNRSRRWAIVAAIAVVSAVGARLLTNTRVIEQLNLKAYDAHFLLRGAEPVPDIVLGTLHKDAFDRYLDPQLFWHPHSSAAIKAPGPSVARCVRRA